MGTSSFGPAQGTSRRSLLKGSAAAVALAATPSMIAACSSSSSGAKGASATTSAATVAGSTITFGSNYSDPGVKGAFAALATQATASTQVKITVNTVDHNTFQTNITNYLQGTPDDLATWFAGYRMQYFAAQGLLSPVDDVWDKIGSSFGASAQTLSKGLDGHYYFVPLYIYPWVVFYNKSTFAKYGYTVPTTWDAFIALAKKMQKDKLIPIAFADKDQWPALGMFDIINLRVNGYDKHLQLMQNKIAYDDPSVTAVFNQWRELMPYLQPGAAGRGWQEAAVTLEKKQAGMMFQGSNQVAANYAAKNLPDLDFFPFPAINPAYGQDYMDAPADGFMLPKKAKNQAAAKAVLEYIGTGPAESTYLKTDKWDVGLAQGIDTSSYNAIQTKSAAAIAACKNVSQFGDRDTDPAMAAALEAQILNFIQNSSPSNVKSIQTKLVASAKDIFS